MQGDDLDVLAAFTSLLRTANEVNMLSSKPLDQWPTYATTLQKISLKDGKRVYQCQDLCNYDRAKDYYSTHHQEHCASITGCLKSRLAWSHLQLIRDVIFMLATQGREKALDEESDPEAERVDPQSPDWG